MARGPDWPAWWFWPIELTVHLRKRMADRRFNEIDLRVMLESVTSLRPDTVEGRWVARTEHEREAWEVIVEPDEALGRIAIVTAYPMS